MRFFPFCQGAGIHEGDLLDKSWHEVIEKAVSCSLDGKKVKKQIDLLTRMVKQVQIGILP